MTRLPLIGATLLGAALALAPAAPAAAKPDPICIYPYDGGWCTPDPDDYVTEYCVYPYDGGWCFPWVELPPV